MLYQLNEYVELLKLKYGEILLINKETGYWVKTSISFLPIYKLLKKGIEKYELDNYLESKYRERKKDIERVIELIRSNGLLQFYDFKMEGMDLENLNLANIISKYSLHDKFISFINNYFYGKTLFVIFENDINFINSFDELEKIKKEINLFSVFRIDYPSLNEKIVELLINSPFDEIQLNLKEFFIEKAEEKLKLIENLKRKKRLNLRIDLIEYSSYKKKESIALPVDVIEPHSYTFTFEDILLSKDKIHNKIKKFFKVWEIFHTEIRIPKKSTIKVQIDNLFSFMVIFPIKRSTCGAGKLNFFIDESGDIYPCKYAKNYKMGNVTDGICKQGTLINEICRGCTFLNFCGGIGHCIPEKDFVRTCKFMRIFFKKSIENFSIDLLKRLEEYNSNRQRETISEKEIKDSKIRLIKRFTCLPGIY